MECIVILRPSRTSPGMRPAESPAGQSQSRAPAGNLLHRARVSEVLLSEHTRASDRGAGRQIRGRRRKRPPPAGAAPRLTRPGAEVLGDDLFAPVFPPLPRLDWLRSVTSCAGGGQPSPSRLPLRSHRAGTRTALRAGLRPRSPASCLTLGQGGAFWVLSCFLRADMAPEADAPPAMVLPFVAEGSAALACGPTLLFLGHRGTWSGPFFSMAWWFPEGCGQHAAGGCSSVSLPKRLSEDGGPGAT